MHQSSALYDPIRSATPSQRLAAEAHRARMCRISGAAQATLPAPARFFAAKAEPVAPPIPDVMLRIAHEAIDRYKVPLSAVHLIQRAVLVHYPDVTRRDIMSGRRTKNIVLPRQVAMYMVKKLTLLSLPQIGARFGGRDHTTVIHAVRKIEHLITKDPELAAVVTDIEQSLEKAEANG